MLTQHFKVKMAIFLKIKIYREKNDIVLQFCKLLHYTIPLLV